MNGTGPDKADQLSAVVLGSLDAPESAGGLARRAYESRSSFFRLFQALIKESPGAMRRRLLLERAAWQLRDTRASVTEVGLNASYESLEGFTRAFGRAFGLSPSLYRRTRTGRIHLPAPNHFHFRPDTGFRGATKTMDLFELFAGTDAWYARRLLQEAAKLTDEQLDSPVSKTGTLSPWDTPDKSLRVILDRIVQTKEVWTAALTGGEMPKLDEAPAEDRTAAAMLERFEKTEARFLSFFRDIRDRGAWDESFVDALCEPAETFTFGGVFSDVITFNSFRRLAALDAFHQLGVHVQGSGSPIEYENALKGSDS
ncbi:MAG: helix-turn-helix domain-containing protein [Acidobacteriota bacterium]